MEGGLVRETKQGKQRSIILPANVYAACNRVKVIPGELLSRFQFKLHFKSYSRDEFLEVTRKALIKLEDVKLKLASYIAQNVAEYSRDVRDAVGIARLARRKEEIDKLLKIQRKYRDSFRFGA